LFWLPLIAVIVLLLALGLSIWLSALVAKYRDVRHAVPFLVQVWLFATPIVYPLSMVPERWRWLVALNPMAGLVEAFRRSIFGLSVDGAPLLWAVLLALVLIVTGSIFFHRTERMVADVL
jgi:lipopolysaccharide transport system permease protein